MALIRYTTPVIAFNFDDVNVTEITSAYLTVKQLGQVIIERDLTTAEVAHTDSINALAWLLTQTETGKLSKALNVQICCDWLLSNGLRGRSNILSLSVEDSGKNEVIS